MPIRVQNGLPAIKALENENIFVMDEDRAEAQDIRPLRMLLLNLMPKKEETETQFLRLLSNTPLQLDMDLLMVVTHDSKNTSKSHLDKFYHSFEQVKQNKYDGMIITGAPVESLPFEVVDYWEELCEIMRWSRTNVYSTFYVCWGAQAGLYYHYGIPKYPLEEKLSGVYTHKVLQKYHPLMRGFDDCFKAPHSRHATVSAQDILDAKQLILLAASKLAGVDIVASTNAREFFVLGHHEYDRDTLKKEFFRDFDRGMNPMIPVNYFENDDIKSEPVKSWRSHAYLLYSNWLNYIVYQKTPYDLNTLVPIKE